MKLYTLAFAALFVASITACSNKSQSANDNENPVTEEKQRAEADINSISSEDAPAERLGDVLADDIDQTAKPSTDNEQTAPPAPIGKDIADEFNKTMNKTMVIDFNATWCGPCRQFAPAFAAAEAKYGDKIDFVSIDVDEHPIFAEEFKVEGIPTVIILRPDGSMKRFVGTGDILPAEKFMAIIKNEIK